MTITSAGNSARIYLSSFTVQYSFFCYYIEYHQSHHVALWCATFSCMKSFVINLLIYRYIRDINATSLQACILSKSTIKENKCGSPQVTWLTITGQSPDLWRSGDRRQKVGLPSNNVQLMVEQKRLHTFKIFQTRYSHPSLSIVSNSTGMFDMNGEVDVYLI